MKIKNSGPSSVKASETDFIKQLKDVASDTKSKLAKIEADNKKSNDKDYSYATPKVSSVTPVSSSDTTERSKILAPAGNCPVNPKRVEGVITDEAVSEWALILRRNYGYSLEAINYWIRNYFDINGGDYERIKFLVQETLN